MAKKKKNDDDDKTFVFDAPDVSMKKINETYIVVSTDSALKKRTKFDELRIKIENLKVDECIKIKNKDFDLSMYELKQRAANIAFGHARKHVEKKFTTGQISSTEFEILRIK